MDDEIIENIIVRQGEYTEESVMDGRICEINGHDGTVLLYRT
jgi:hypothetical protein